MNHSSVLIHMFSVLGRSPVIVLVLAALMGCAHLRSGSADPCLKALPTSLAAILPQSYPGFRLPTAADTDAHWRAMLHQAACPLLAQGDYDGDTRPDWAVLMPSQEDASVLLVVALSGTDHWVLTTLPNWCGNVAGCYVETTRAARYVRSRSMAEPLEQDERDTLEAKNDAVLSGVFEATGVVYAREGSEWHHVWTSQ